MKTDKTILQEFDKRFGTVSKFQNSSYGDFKAFLLSKVGEAREETIRDVLKVANKYKEGYSGIELVEILDFELAKLSTLQKGKDKK